MLKVKSEQDAVKYSVEQIRKRYKRRIREQQLHQLFSAIRNKLIQEEHIRNEQIEHPQYEIAPIYQQPLPANYYQYLQHAMRMPHIQNHPNHTQIIQYPPPIIMPQIEENIYFQKNGIIVYKNLLGCGTYAQVWEGKIKNTGEKIAAKQVKTLQENQRKCLTQLSSEHVVKVLDIFTHKSKSFIILQFCDKNLREQLKECNFQIEMALKYFEQLVLGMDVLQSKNIIHRDLKFQNILVKDKKIKIADFGLAKCLGNELQVQSRRCGTPYTMAPEIYFSISRIALYTIKSDIWSLGVILHEMLYRVHPFDGNATNFKKEKRVRVVKRFGILDKIIDQCLVFNPFMRINWSQFKILFNYYLQEKHYYFAPKEKPIAYKEEKYEPKAMKKQQQVKFNAIKINNQVKVKQRPKIRQKYRQQSKDRREDRTPSRRKKFSIEKNIVEKDKFEGPIVKHKRLTNHQKANTEKKVQIRKESQTRERQQEKQMKVNLIDLRQHEQRPLHNEKRYIGNEKMKKQLQQQPKIRLLVQLLTVLIIIFTVLYISFD